MNPREWQRFWKHKGAMIGVALVLFVLLFAWMGPWFAAHDPNEQFTDLLLRRDGLPRGPGERQGFVLGGDVLGRDELARLLHGGRVSMTVALIATGIAVLIGMAIGITSGYFGGAYDSFVMRSVDVALSVPFLLIAIALHRVVDHPSSWTLSLLLGLLSWTTLARVVRAKTQQVCALSFIEAARALGASWTRVLLRHVLPNVVGPAVVVATSLVAQMVIVESAMSYLGLGVPPPQASWGSMLREGQDFMAYFPRLVLLPGALIVLTVFGFNLLGEALRDALDPRD